MKELTDLLKSFYGLAASIGVLLPGYTFFTSNSPPLFKGISIITSALSIAVLVIIANSQSSSKHLKKIRAQKNRNAWLSLIGAFIILLLYLLMLDYTTVINFSSGVRWQVGFNTQVWSLT